MAHLRVCNHLRVFILAAMFPMTFLVSISSGDELVRLKDAAHLPSNVQAIEYCSRLNILALSGIDLTKNEAFVCLYDQILQRVTFEKRFKGVDGIDVAFSDEGEYLFVCILSIDEDAFHNVVHIFDLHFGPPTDAVTCVLPKDSRPVWYGTSTGLPAIGRIEPTDIHRKESQNLLCFETMPNRKQLYSLQVDNFLEGNPIAASRQFRLVAWGRGLKSDSFSVAMKNSTHKQEVRLQERREVTSIAFGWNEKAIAVGTSIGQVILGKIDGEKVEVQRELIATEIPESRVVDLEFSRDGKYLATQLQRYLIIWDLRLENATRQPVVVKRMNNLLGVTWIGDRELLTLALHGKEHQIIMWRF